MGTLWQRGGKLVANDGGTALVECDDCPCGSACSHCVGGRAPKAYLVHIEGIVAGGGAACLELNGDFRVDYVSEQKIGSAWICRYQGVWHCDDPPDEILGCLYLVLDIRWNLDVFEAMSIWVQGFRFEDLPDFTGPGFLDTDVPECDCNNWNARDIPLQSPVGQLWCDCSAATCEITAIP